jgi:hypothetical protein
MELTIENLIKIIIGVLVVVAVAYGIYYFFANNVLDSFKNIGIGDNNTASNTVKFLMTLY